MKCFETGKIGKLTLKNRLIMAPMAIGGLVEPDGRLSEQAISYYRERARGGVGMIITGLVTVDSVIEKNLINGWAAAFPRLDSGTYVPRLSKLADALHDYGAKLAVQLTAGFGRVAAHFILREGQPVGPSAVPCFWNSKVITRELTVDEIGRLAKAFALAARIAKSAGVDAIELHGHEGYLLDQFKTKLWNKRQDQYGGDLKGRLRFSKEVIEAIKKAVGQDFPVIYRFGLTHYLEGGREIEEGLEIAKHLESFGVDALHVDAGCYETWYWAHPTMYQDHGCMADMAAAAKQVVNIPVIAVGRLDDAKLAEGLLHENKADFIALGRALLADSEWPEKIRANREDDIRPCIGDHDGCLGRAFSGKPLSCTVNPTVGLEQEMALTPAAKPLKILVVGGGPAGMEAARVATLRGHLVTLWEKKDRLGGNMVPGSVPGFKRDIGRLVRYYEKQLNAMGLNILLNQEATPRRVEQAGADVVIVATGADPILLGMNTSKQVNVVTAIDLLLGAATITPGENVVVIGGGEVGCETAIYLAESGARVTVIEALPQILNGVFGANRQYLLRMLEQHQVRVLSKTKLEAIIQRTVVARGGDGAAEEIPCVMVVLAMGLVPRVQLQESLKDKVPRLHVIGDCVAPRGIFDAIREGYRIARLI